MGREERLSLFNKCAVKVASQFLHRIIDGVCGRGNAQYPAFSEQWSLDEWWEVVDASTEIFREAARQNWKKDKFGEAVDMLDGPHKQFVIDAYFARQDEIRNHLSKLACSLSNAQLRDFDWQMKLVMSSDKLASVNEPLLNLDLGLIGENGSEHISVELKKADLQRLITSMEAANKALLQVKT